MATKTCTNQTKHVCEHCLAEPGAEHELSCPAVSLDVFRAVTAETIRRVGR